ncbi:Na+/H+ antiporter NhaA [Cupriavidus necator]|uniref:Na+/H+ antiporter NhaA n=1 Tax=Cupriavidus necator TaxID=106590 RepID=UPI002E76F610|nr:Na+/H+ antiporter NhaA [Cupriavidus necator]
MLNKKGLRERAATPAPEPEDLARPLRRLRQAQRDLLPPVTRVQMALHPWVAFTDMPLFALANAGVSLDGVDLATSTSRAMEHGTC